MPASRRHVRRVLEEAGHEQWLDAAQLAVSEVASNAVLHAHTEFEVRSTSPRRRCTCRSGNRHLAAGAPFLGTGGHHRAQPGRRRRGRRRLRRTRRRAEQLDRTAELLAPPGPSLIVEVRHWACRQVLEQLEGAPARRWPARSDGLRSGTPSTTSWAGGGVTVRRSTCPGLCAPSPRTCTRGSPRRPELEVGSAGAPCAGARERGYRQGSPAMAALASAESRYQQAKRGAGLPLR